MTETSLIFSPARLVISWSARDFSSAVSGFELYAINNAKQKNISDTQVCNGVTLRLLMKQDFFGEEI